MFRITILTDDKSARHNVRAFAAMIQHSDGGERLFSGIVETPHPINGAAEFTLYSALQRALEFVPSGSDLVVCTRHEFVRRDFEPFMLEGNVSSLSQMLSEFGSVKNECVLSLLGMKSIRIIGIMDDTEALRIEKEHLHLLSDALLREPGAMFMGSAVWDHPLTGGTDSEDEPDPSSPKM